MGEAVKAQAILIVEDEVLIRHDLMDFFEDRGFAAFEAQNADDAIKILSANPHIHVVLTDVQMPGSMDGLKLARYVRDCYPPVLIVVVSGAINPDADDLPEGAFFIPKPFDPRQVLTQIEQMSAPTAPAGYSPPA